VDGVVGRALRVHRQRQVTNGSRRVSHTRAGSQDLGVERPQHRGHDEWNARSHAASPVPGGNATLTTLPSAPGPPSHGQTPCQGTALAVSCTEMVSTLGSSQRKIRSTHRRDGRPRQRRRLFGHRDRATTGWPPRRRYRCRTRGPLRHRVVQSTAEVDAVLRLTAPNAAASPWEPPQYGRWLRASRRTRSSSVPRPRTRLRSWARTEAARTAATYSASWTVSRPRLWHQRVDELDVGPPNSPKASHNRL